MRAAYSPKPVERAFGKWIFTDGESDTDEIPAEYFDIWRRAAVIEMFPAYKYEDLDTAPAEVWTMLRLRNIATTVHNARS